jgi:spore coat protein U-like protein
LFTWFESDKEKFMRKSPVLNVAVTAALLVSASLASAATSTANLTVTATVNTNCSISTTPVAFGVYDPFAAGALDATGTVSIACTKGTAPSIGLGLGLFPSGAVRQMDDGGGNRVTYELFQPASNVVGAACAYTTAWGTAAGTTVIATAAPSKVARSYNVCGRMAAGQDPTAGSYSDTVIATVTF